MAYYTSAGTVLSVSAALPATYDTTGYEALTFTDVGEVTGVPSHGAAATLVTHNPLATRITGKLKGSIDFGSTTLPMALDFEDAGQLILDAHAYGANTDDPVSVKIAYSDGSVEYFTALVMSFQRAADGTDSVMAASVELQIDTATVVDPVVTP